MTAAYHDGRSGTRHPATLEFSGALVTVRWGYHERREDLAKVRISPPVSGEPRRLTFFDGTYCEVANEAALVEMLARAGDRAPKVPRRQSIARIAAASVTAIVQLALVGYFYGLPRAAHRAATKMSAHTKTSLAARTRYFLDQRYLQPTTLPQERRNALIAGFNALQYPDDAPERDVSVLFRAGPGVGPHAFTLADGTLVLLDELVMLADHDEQVYAVMGHELGHAYYGHGLEAVLRETMLATLIYALVRDVTRVFRDVPQKTLSVDYPRAFEAEADRYAIRLLETNGIAPGRLQEMRDKLGKNRRGGWGNHHRA